MDVKPADPARAGIHEHLSIRGSRPGDTPRSPAFEAERRAARASEELGLPRRTPAPHDVVGVPSLLKFSISSADVNASFAIDEGSRHVTVTMSDRTTGEVLKEIPSREIREVIDRLREGGLVVDVSG